MLRATAKTHKIAVFKNHHTELGESITLSEFWVPMDANHSGFQRIKWDAKTIQKQKATSPAHLIIINIHWYSGIYSIFSSFYPIWFSVAWGQATI